MAKKKASPNKKAKKQKTVDPKALTELINRGKKQGHLTYEEINAALPEEMLSSDQIDETLMLFDDLDIEILDKDKPMVASGSAKKSKAARITEKPETPDFGTVTDPVKMYLREMGLVTLLSREGEVVIAKKIEAGEQEVLKALLETTTAAGMLLKLGEKIESQEIRPKHVLRDLDEGDAYIDEALQIENFLSTIHSIKKIDDENKNLREKLFGPAIDAAERRRLRRSVARRNRKIFDFMKSWRLEGAIIDKMEETIREQIRWFDEMDRNLSGKAKLVESSVNDIRKYLDKKSNFCTWAKKRCGLDPEMIATLFDECNDLNTRIANSEFELKAKGRGLKRIMTAVREGRIRAKLAKSELIKANLRLVATGGCNSWI